METKSEKFKRLAEGRTNKILKYINLLGNLSNSSNYEYTEEEVKKIFNVIEKELKITKSKFDTFNKNFKL